MTMKPRVLLRIGVTIFIMVVVMTVLTRCGRTYHDSAPTNPVQSRGTPVSADYTTPGDGQTMGRVVHRDLTDSEAQVFLTLFDGSRADPRPARWQAAGSLTLTDTQGRETSIGLFVAGGDRPDVYELDNVYYRKHGLIDALDAWADAPPQPQPESTPDAAD